MYECPEVLKRSTCLTTCMSVLKCWNDLRVSLHVWVSWSVETIYVSNMYRCSDVWSTCLTTCTSVLMCWNAAVVRSDVPTSSDIQATLYNATFVYVLMAHDHYIMWPPAGIYMSHFMFYYGHWATKFQPPLFNRCCRPQRSTCLMLYMSYIIWCDMGWLRLVGSLKL